MNYDRPTGAQVIAKKRFTGHWNYVHKARVEGDQHHASYATSKVVEYALFY